MQLVASLAEYYRRWTLMETILDSSNVRGWRRVFGELLPDPEMKERVHHIFNLCEIASLTLQISQQQFVKR